MNTTMLFQRVRPPAKVEEGFFDGFLNAFGGGHKNGGLSPKAMAVLAKIFEFDYMGAAEYEYGAVPNALRDMSTSKDELVLNSVTVPLEDIKILPIYAKERKPLKNETGTIHYVCGRSQAFEVLRRLKAIVLDEEGLKYSTNGGWADPNIKLRDGTQLGLYLKYGPRVPDDCCGGLELNNGFFATAKEDMAQKFLTLFKTAP